MSDIDDDLLELADIGPGSESEPETDLQYPYPLEGKYRDAEDRAKLDALPEIEREEILYERAQETQRFEERRYLSQRHKQMARRPTESDSEDEIVPAAKRQRGTTGVTTGTKSSLEALKSRRLKQQRTADRRRRDEDDSDFGESEEEDSDEESDRRGAYDSDYDSEEEQIKRSFRTGRRAEWADEEDDEKAQEARKLANETITLSDANKIRWGRALFTKFCFTPGFADAVPGCFVRVNIGVNRERVPVYRMCQIKEIVSHKKYRVNDQVVDLALVASLAGSERTLQFDICSDAPITEAEFEYWCDSMKKAGLSLPSRRRAQLTFQGVRALSKRALTSEEIDEMVKRRAELNGQRGANAVLAKAELLHQREIAIDEGNDALVREIDEKLSLRGGSAGSGGSGGSAMDKLVKVNERNKKANVVSVRKAEVSLHSQRRKAGATGVSNPFSRLRTTARVFYESDAKPEADTSAAKAAAEIRETAKVAKQLQNVDMSMPLGAVDDMIARIDIKLDIDI